MQFCNKSDNCCKKSFTRSDHIAGQKGTCFNSIDTSLQAKDDNRPKRPNVTVKFPPLSLTVIVFTPVARAFFVRMARTDVFGEEGSFLTIRTMLAVIVVFEGKSELPLYLIEELGRSLIFRSLYLMALGIKS
ncbi:hypothetical protein AVEN_214171-1 [Araneus ventricosus]|uniref:Uncharacterized protein n=1 Tax=Araneus ventricosus TaxID=182803 RepID=A0A4Y2WMI4_ARAVE|nr:hypothetical protein AVEN_214171-1 [Araneus ventricosus]